MKARYLLRLDDACPTMRHSAWSRMESILDCWGILPLVAVVPDNQDPELQIEVPDPAFWDRVRTWQGKGWEVAMHGYQHCFHYVSRRQLILPFYDRSEFGGLSLTEQAVKIRSAWKVFESMGIYPKVWIAPAHSFDHTTLQALRQETPIRIVSDGIAWNQYYEDDFYWLPQQLWSYAVKSSGFWTICLHPNSMDDQQLDQFERLLEQESIRSQIVSLQNIYLTTRSRSLADRAYYLWFWSRDSFYKRAVILRRYWYFWQNRLCK